MADRWNQPQRIQCKFCNCWYANNRLDIENHERGATHQANVDKELDRTRKDKQDLILAEKIYRQEMEKIEAAALRAFEEDAKQNAFAKDELKRVQEARAKQSSSST